MFKVDVFWVVTLCSVVVGYPATTLHRRESLKIRIRKLICLRRCCEGHLQFNHDIKWLVIRWLQMF